MAVPPPPIVKPYSASSTDASWKAAKSDKTRDKWHTELGEALRAAKLAYDKIKFEWLDVGLLTAKQGKFDIVKDVEVAKIAAEKHHAIVVKPAIKALEKAHSKAVWAGRNVVITQGANTKAKQIAADLGPRLQQLKAIHFRDFDNEIARLKRNMKFTYDNFNSNMIKVLRDADAFVTTVRKDPTPDTFNDGIQDAARGITQMIGQVQKLKKNGHDLGKKHPQALFNALEDWAEGRDQLPDNANKKAVLAAVSKFELLADGVENWWS